MKSGEITLTLWNHEKQTHFTISKLRYCVIHQAFLILGGWQFHFPCSLVSQSYQNGRDSACQKFHNFRQKYLQSSHRSHDELILLFSEIALMEPQDIFQCPICFFQIRCSDQHILFPF